LSKKGKPLPTTGDVLEKNSRQPRKERITVPKKKKLQKKLKGKSGGKVAWGSMGGSND